MDLRSIINSDSTNAPPPRAAPNREPSSNQNHHYLQQGHQVPYHVPSPAYQGGRHDTRPPQPPPLQPPPHRDIRSPTGSLSHQSTQSPYTNTPTSSLSGTQYPFPHHVNQSSAQGSQAPAFYPQRDRTTTIVAPGPQNYGQPSPSILTPTATTPGSSYGCSQHQRPQSSHSSMTPISAQSHVQNFPRDGPHAIQTHMINQLPRYSGQHYQSQPGTPLGPPPIIGRPSPRLHREGSSSYSYDHQRTQSGSSYGHPQGAIPSPITEAPGPLASSPTGYDHRQPPSRRRSYLTDEDRERSLSVSPKTRLPSQTRVEPYEVTQEHSRIWTNGQVTPAKRKGIDHISEEKPPLTAHEPNQPYQPDHMDNEVMNSEFVSSNVEEQRILKDLSHGQGQQRMNTLSPRIASSPISNQYTKEADWPVSQGMPHSVSKRMSNSGLLPATPLRQQSSTSQSQNARQTPSSRISPRAPLGGHISTPLTSSVSIVQSSSINLETTSSPIAVSSPQQPARKRQRHEEPPIYARSVKTNRGNSMLPSKRPPVNRAATVKQEFIDAQIKAPAQTPPLIIKDESNGYPPSGTEILLPKAQPAFEDDGPLGPWEPSILNLLPAEELTRAICDFIFAEVVTRDDVGPGAVIEIEAKLGQLIDKNTNDRLRLPVATECILSKNDPNLRISFKSSMTEVNDCITPEQSDWLIPSQQTVSAPHSELLPKRGPQDLSHQKAPYCTTRARSQTPHPNDLRPHPRTRRLLRALPSRRALSPALHTRPAQPPPQQQSQSPYHNRPEDRQRTRQDRQGAGRGPGRVQPTHAVRLARERESGNGV